MEWIVGIGIFTFLLFKFPKKIMILAVALAFISALTGGYFYLDNYFIEKKKTAIKIAVSFDDARCSKEYPLVVKIKNGSGSEVEAIKFSVEGRRTGYSDPIYESGFQDYRTDKIMQAGESHISCWKVPKLSYGKPENYRDRFPPKGVVWNASWISPQFSN
ncbi:hypothetical protein ACQU0X_31765 [Pseudovibrio ascidiaceicola]|uniref:hypothetical protein n=1 Tax=Pseudovibrio ascidiaceicola TaxID=285279 RepID=UPI003D35CFB2